VGQGALGVCSSGLLKSMFESQGPSTDRTVCLIINDLDFPVGSICQKWICSKHSSTANCLRPSDSKNDIVDKEKPVTML
jgi:hypothetical protein